MKENIDWSWTTESRLPSVRGASHQLLGNLLAELRREQWSEADIFGIHLAVEEALVNAIRHGNDSDQSKQVHVVCKLASHRLRVEIADEGAGFDPNEVPDCTREENWHRPSGRGIMLMRNYMSRVEYLDGGHRVVMERDRANGQSDSNGQHRTSE
ncbi:MAG TPA: ATP-binding protein [Pirellulales bacterium]|jgi:serine/threonine-protein kinase RsbW